MAKKKAEGEARFTVDAEGKARVVAKTGMWRGGLQWAAGLNAVDPATLTDEVLEALESDQGNNFTVL